MQALSNLIGGCSARSRNYAFAQDVQRSVACEARKRVMGVQQPSMKSSRAKTVPPCVYSSPRYGSTHVCTRQSPNSGLAMTFGRASPTGQANCREEAQGLPEVAVSFKHHDMASCIVDTPIAKFMLDSADVDHMAVSVWCDHTAPCIPTGRLVFLDHTTKH